MLWCFAPWRFLDLMLGCFDASLPDAFLISCLAPWCFDALLAGMPCYLMFWCFANVFLQNRVFCKCFDALMLLSLMLSWFDALLFDVLMLCSLTLSWFHAFMLWCLAPWCFLDFMPCSLNLFCILRAVGRRNLFCILRAVSSLSHGWGITQYNYFCMMSDNMDHCSHRWRWIMWREG